MKEYPSPEIGIFCHKCLNVQNYGEKYCRDRYCGITLRTREEMITFLNEKRESYISNLNNCFKHYKEKVRTIKKKLLEKEPALKLEGFHHLRREIINQAEKFVKDLKFRFRYEKYDTHKDKPNYTAASKLEKLLRFAEKEVKNENCQVCSDLSLEKHKKYIFNIINPCSYCYSNHGDYMRTSSCGCGTSCYCIGIHHCFCYPCQKEYSYNE